MGIFISKISALLAAVLLASSVSSAESWELRPAEAHEPGSAEIEAGQIDDALRILTVILESGTSDLDFAVIRNLCVAYAMNLEYEIATRYCNQAVVHSSNGAVDHNNRGVLRAVMGDPRGAIRDFQRANCMRVCSGNSDCDAESVQAMVRRNLARVKKREALAVDSAVLFRPGV